MTEARLLLGDCRERLLELGDESVDAIVTDPPYGIGFMGKRWDDPGSFLERGAATAADAARTRCVEGQRFQAFTEDWAEQALRVLKPGGHLLAFGGPRTEHRLACGVENAGFEIRDKIMWLFGQGMPKGKNFDGAYEGWGTALKPGYEPVVVARKPPAGNVAENLARHGVGAFHVAASLIAFRGDEDERESKEKNRHGDFGTEQGGNAVYGDYSMLADRENYDPTGRWPANLVLTHTDECVRVGDRQVAADGHWPSARPAGSQVCGPSGHVGQDGLQERDARGERVALWECSDDCPVRLLDEGALEEGFGPSRFFYVGKTSRSERNAGLGADFEERMLRWSKGDANPGSFQSDGVKKEARNHHPTVKPVDLMRWLVRLVVPVGALVVDPFLGSGSTGIACGLEGMRFVGIEENAEYMAIAEARIRLWREHGEDALRIVAEREVSDRARKAREDAGQLDLFA